MGWRVYVMNSAGERGRGGRVGRLLVMEWGGSGQFCSCGRGPRGLIDAGGVRVVSLHLLCMQQRIGGDVKRGGKGEKESGSGQEVRV
jgi:hypothetical protein